MKRYAIIALSTLHIAAHCSEEQHKSKNRQEADMQKVLWEHEKNIRLEYGQNPTPHQQEQMRNRITFIYGYVKRNKHLFISVPYAREALD